MKLFKNGVGRPSNETKELRRVFVVSVAAIIISLFALLVSLLTKNGILTGSLKGTTGYTVSYGISNTNSSDVTITKYPSYKTHTGTVQFPAAPSYTVKSGKTCSFKGWIIQRTSDGRYRVKNKGTGNNAWYNSSKDPKISWEYNYLKSGSLSVNSSVKLYAAFDCKTSNSSKTTTTTKKAASTISMPKYNSADRPDSRYAGELIINTTYGKFSVTTSPKASSVSVTSSDTKAIQVMKYGSNSWGLKVGGESGRVVTITATDSNGGKLSYTYVTRDPYKIGYLTSAQTGDYIYDVHKTSNLNTKLWSNEFFRVGYKFDGWRAYRMINNKKTYFQWEIINKGWICSSASCARKIGDKENISYMEKYTPKGADIYMEAAWVKKSYKEFYVSFCETAGNCSWGYSSGKLYGMKNQIIDVNDRISSNTLKKSGKTFDGWYPYIKDNNNKMLYLSYNSNTKKCQWQSSKATVVPNKAVLGTYIDNCTSTGAEIYLEAKWK